MYIVHCSVGFDNIYIKNIDDKMIIENKKDEYS